MRHLNDRMQTSFGGLFPPVVVLVMLMIAVFAAQSVSCFAEVPILLEDTESPGPNVADEPLRANYSLEKATQFLDSAALHWQQKRKCFTCHTNVAYLYARPLMNADHRALQQVRHAADALVEKRWPGKGPRWDAEVVAMAAALSFYDAQITNQLSDQAKTALDRMWTLQRPDGGWDWLKCEWPPFEYDDHYGVTLAAIAIGVAPGDYANSQAARDGLERIRSYFENNPPANDHHRAMLLWANSYHEDLITAEQKASWTAKLISLQRPDGGWAAASLGKWERSDGSPQDVETSDGYGTGFVLFVLQQSGIADDDPNVERGLTWLKTHQRQSGRWFTRSLYRDGPHYLSHAGTAFAAMALVKKAEVTRQNSE